MKPILFNTEMVKALLDGRKTVTRRLVKPQPSKKASWLDKCAGVYTFSDATFPHEPYSSGDILYVRETWGIAGFNPESNEMFVEYKADGANANIVLPEEKFQKYYEGMSEAEPDWHPSIHMPKGAARIFLRVTDVRVERLQEITEEQAVKEGVPADWPMDKVYCHICKGEGLIGAVHPVSLGFMEVECPHCEKGTSRFQNLWNSTIKPTDLPLYGWDASPWVWVIGFEKISKEDAYNA